MDRATIEGYLTLFRSTKEDDLTKIGKFGISFVSLFAMEPRRPGSTPGVTASGTGSSSPRIGPGS